MTEFGTKDFSLTLEDRAVPSATSTEARTLATIRLASRDLILTSWVDAADKESFDSLPDVPVVDLAYWFASSWAELVFGLTVPPAIAARSVSPARRWSLSSSLSGQNKAIYEWAKTHAIEFAATDYTLPNIVFRRRDDYMEISWDPRPGPGPGSTTIFNVRPGSTLIGIAEFVQIVRGVLAWVTERCVSNAEDERLRTIGSVLTQDSRAVGALAVRRWFADYRAPSLPIADADLVTLGSTGAAASPTVMFLRSAAGVITVGEAAKILKLVSTKTVTEPAAKDLHALAAGLDAHIDPEAPWDSGLQLARTVRSRLATKYDEPMDIEAVLAKLHVVVREHVFSDMSIEGACFMTTSGTAMSFYNPRGRLARSLVGRRTTLSHELCHLLFDAPHDALGQLDLRVGSSISGSSLIEMRANAFAAEFLLPREAVLGASSNGRLSTAAVAELGKRFHVSQGVVRHQAENQELSIASK